ncbi:hypothetical protein [Nostoc sp.]
MINAQQLSSVKHSQQGEAVLRASTSGVKVLIFRRILFKSKIFIGSEFH